MREAGIDTEKGACYGLKLLRKRETENIDSKYGRSGTALEKMRQDEIRG